MVLVFSVRFADLQVKRSEEARESRLPGERERREREGGIGGVTWRGDHDGKERVAGGGNVGDGRGGGDELRGGEEPDLADLRIADEEAERKQREEEAEKEKQERKKERKKAKK